MAEIKACCREAGNLVETSGDPHRSVRKCLVCGCRHFRFAPNQAVRVTAPVPDSNGADA